MKAFLVLLIALAITIDAQAAKKPAPAKAKAPAPFTEITLRHALQGPAREALAKLTERFNEAQKGQARINLEELGRVADPRHLPQLALLDPDDSNAFFHTLPRFKPLYKAMSEAGEKFSSGQFMAVIAETVDDPAGRVQALPIGMAIPMLFWNRDALSAAGLDPNEAPQTWLQLQKMAGKLYDTGHRCPLTSSRFAWVHLETLSHQNGEPISARDAHGAMRFVLNRMVDVKHLSLIASWQKSRYFHYYGPGDQADRKFMGGECAMVTSSSSLLNTADRTPFGVGIGPLPHYDDVYGATPDKLLPDGAALWLLAGNSKAQDKVAARYIAFMLRPDVQREWVAATGFLPMTRAAVEALADRGTAQRLLVQKAAARPKYGFGLSEQREIIDEELNAIWRDNKAPMAALNDAMRRISATASSPKP